MRRDEEHIVADREAPDPETTRALMRSIAQVASTTGVSLDAATAVLEDLVRLGWSLPAVNVDLAVPEPIGWMVVERPHGRPVVNAWDGIVHPTFAEADAECAHANRPGHGGVDSWRVVAVYDPPLPAGVDAAAGRTS